MQVLSRQMPKFDVRYAKGLCVCVSRLLRFAGASGIVADFSIHNKLLARRLLEQGYRYRKLRKTFSGFYRGCYGLISGYYFWTWVSFAPRTFGA